MLYPSQLYKDELQKKLISKWYDQKYKWYFGGEFYMYSCADNAEWKHDFVHLDKNGEVDGHFAYSYNATSKSMTNFGLISFVENNHELVYDAIQRVKQMFIEGTLRAEFWAFADNPVNKFYEKVIKHYGGEKVGYLHRTAFFGGKYHDTVFYEILAENIPEGRIDNYKQHI